LQVAMRSEDAAPLSGRCRPEQRDRRHATELGNVVKARIDAEKQVRFQQDGLSHADFETGAAASHVTRIDESRKRSNASVIDVIAPDAGVRGIDEKAEVFRV